MSDARKLAELGMSPVLAKELMAIILDNIAGSGDFATAVEAAITNESDVQDAVTAAVAAKTEIAALTSGSNAAAIVAALQA